jgi:hypothetical protein
MRVDRNAGSGNDRRPNRQNEAPTWDARFFFDRNAGSGKGPVVPDRQRQSAAAE